MNYYALPFVSNSELSELWRTINDIKKPENLPAIFGMGNLVDAKITERHKVNHDLLTVDGVTDYEFTVSDFEKAEAMKQAFDEDALLRPLFAKMRFQYVYAPRTLVIEYEGITFTLKAKCKFDGIIRGVLGADIKTTAATSQRSFIEALFFFDVDRQVAWYMDIAKLDRFILVGISKKKNKVGKHEIYRFAITRGDDFYNSGKAKYQHLSFLYYSLTQAFKNEN